MHLERRCAGGRIGHVAKLPAASPTRNARERMRVLRGSTREPILNASLSSAKPIRRPTVATMDLIDRWLRLRPRLRSRAARGTTSQMECVMLNSRLARNLLLAGVIGAGAFAATSAPATAATYTRCDSYGCY